MNRAGLKSENQKFGIIFDMDGVIIDSNPYHKIAWANFLKAKNVEVTEAHFRDLIFGTSGGEAISILMNRQFSKSELNIFCEEIDSEYRRIIRDSDNIELVNGFIAFLESAITQNHKIAVATSAPTENVDLVLDKFDLSARFDLIVDKTKIGRGKPDPEIYCKVIEGLAIVKEHCVVFEDSISGILSARGAGLAVIGLTTSHTAEELVEAGATFIINDFTGISIEDVHGILGFGKRKVTIQPEMIEKEVQNTKLGI